jgi:hypothetical protein
VRAGAAVGIVLVLVLASSTGAQDGGIRRDAGRVDGGRVDAGHVDGGRADAGPGDGGRAQREGGVAAGATPHDEQPAIEAPDEAPPPEGHVPEVTLSIEPREGLVTGDLVHVLITVRLPEGDDVAVPRQELGPFELHDQRHRDAPIDGGLREFRFEIDLLALEPGEHELPALRLRVVTAEGAVGTVRTEPQRITIGSLIANEPDAQPRPPTQPVVVMEDDYTLAWIAGILGGMALTALLTWLVARWWSRRPKKQAPPPPARPAWETALAKLEAMRKRSARMIEEGQQVALIDGVSDALREYLGARFGFNGLESTSDEVVARMRSARLQGATLAEITTLLGECDLVKFAKAMPTPEQCAETIAGAVKIVRSTIPKAAPAITPPARPSGAAASGAGRASAPSTPSTPATPATRATPATASGGGASQREGGGTTLPLILDSASAIDAVVSAAVMGKVGEKSSDPGWDGRIVVMLAPSLPDEYDARQGLRSVHEKLRRALGDTRTASGRPIELTIEHYHESIREKGPLARKTVYPELAAAGAPAPDLRKTPMGNAFEPIAIAPPPTDTTTTDKTTAETTETERGKEGRDP